MDERRADKRTPWYFTAMIKVYGREHYSCVMDISRSGLRIACQDELGTGIPVGVLLSSPTGDVYDLEGKINAKIPNPEDPEAGNNYSILLTKKPESYENLIDSLDNTGETP